MTQGSAQGIQDRSRLLKHTLSIWDGQRNQPSPGPGSILGLVPPVYSVSIVVGTISCSVLKYKPTGGPKDLPRVSRIGLDF
jgi:hypothetical protein